ncbi:hypothetical protein Bsp3421_000342 (plasmid) [Burkholderia sp. FERM BP-3421]|jgi:hypothetical protein|nr:hypothetical protein [Burkholderia sp. FERM BP-3421]WDD90494.1 hypothetical protein Bsp3421_000342 [Burkholderia sp. FERM BP-3421]
MAGFIENDFPVQVIGCAPVSVFFMCAWALDQIIRDAAKGLPNIHEL